MLVLRKCGHCGMARGIAFRRSDSTLAEKMMRASEGVELTETEAKQRDRLEVELDEKVANSLNVSSFINKLSFQSFSYSNVL